VSRSAVDETTLPTDAYPRSSRSSTGAKAATPAGVAGSIQ
jgi:hypothetical protein